MKSALRLQIKFYTSVQNIATAVRCFAFWYDRQEATINLVSSFCVRRLLFFVSMYMHYANESLTICNYPHLLVNNYRYRKGCVQKWTYWHAKSNDIIVALISILRKQNIGKTRQCGMFRDRENFAVAQQTDKRRDCVKNLQTFINKRGKLSLN